MSVVWRGQSIKDGAWSGGVNFRNERGCHQMPKEKKDEKELKLPDEQVGIERKKK